MTTETLTPPTEATTEATTEAPTTQAPAAAPAAGSNTYSVLGVVLSILSIPTGMGPLAVAGVILGFLGRTREPAHVTTANWAIIIGFVSLFGWIFLAFAGAVLFAPWAFGAWAFGAF
jgi:hypothetical protein